MAADVAAPPGDPRWLARTSLLEALLARRSRRFGRGMSLAGPLAFESLAAPAPLTLPEEAALAFAANGVTGPLLAEMPYTVGAAEGGYGHILMNFVGRTVGSADAVHTNVVFVTNDAGTWLLRRPQDYPRGEIPDLVAAGRRGELASLYERSRVQVADRRAEVARRPPDMPTFNQWTVNRPGTTYFLPVCDMSALFITVLLTLFGEAPGHFVVDERNRFQPAGVGRFARSRGGHLDDDPASGGILPLGLLETWLCELAAIEQGAIMQNLGLAAAALRLGGFQHFAAHPSAWLVALGFRMQDVPLSRIAAAGPVTRGLMRALGKDIPVPTATGLERGGEELLRPFCPPTYPDMEAAVLAYVDYKYAPGSGTYRDGGRATAWRDGAGMQAALPRYSDATIAATIACCEYVYGRYGRFPATSGPYRTVMAFQAHRADDAFYAEHYRPGTVWPDAPE